MGATILVPSNVSSTCGKKMFDYCLVHNDIFFAIHKLEADLTAPWKTHTALRIEILRTARSVCVNKVMSSPKFEATDGETCEPITWTQAKEFTADYGDACHNDVNHIPEYYTNQYNSSIRCDAVNLGVKYANWSVAAAAQNYCKVGVSDLEPCHFRRGLLPAVKQVPLVKKDEFFTDKSRPLQSEQEDVSYWDAINAWLKDLTVIRDPHHVKSIVGMLKNVAPLAEFRVDKEHRLTLGLLWQSRLNDAEFMGDEMLLKWAGEANDLAIAAHRAHGARASKAFKDWILDNLPKGAGPLHKWTRSGDAIRRPVDEMPYMGETVSTPNEVMVASVQKWTHWWTKSTSRHNDIDDCIKESRRLARTTDFHHFDESDLDNTLASFGKKDAVGLDQWAFHEIRSLSKEAKLEFLELLNESAEQVILPLQARGNMQVSLGTPGGGERTVGLMATFYRTEISLLRPEISSWSKEHGRFWDTAIKGSSCLQAALERSAIAEIAFLVGDNSLRVPVGHGEILRLHRCRSDVQTGSGNS